MGGARRFVPEVQVAAECEVTYVELAQLLKEQEETEASVTNKLARGTFPATWFLAVFAALDLDGVALEEI